LSKCKNTAHEQHIKPIGCALQISWKSITKGSIDQLFEYFADFEWREGVSFFFCPFFPFFFSFFFLCVEGFTAPTQKAMKLESVKLFYMNPEKIMVQKKDLKHGQDKHA
jgi:hypothetical protein